MQKTFAAWKPERGNNIVSYKARYGFEHRTVNSLYRYYWQSGGMSVMDNGWESFDDFVKWCSVSGYRKNYHLNRLDSTKPHGPENSFWDRTMRERPGKKIEEPKESPCETCRFEPDCNRICLQRAAWWDVKMQEVRRMMGVVKP